MSGILRRLNKLQGRLGYFAIKSLSLSVSASKLQLPVLNVAIVAALGFEI